MILNDKVYINNTLLDLGEAGGVTLEYAVSDPADMAAIYTPGSWTVNLPKSAVNLQAFGFMTEPGIITDAPHIEHPCQVMRNGVPLFDDGKLTVIDVTETINAVITWSTNERLTDLSRSTLRDLEIDKVMEWDPSTFETSEDDNFKWVVDTGYKSAGPDGVMNYNARGFRPAVKASYLLGAMLPGLTIGQAYWDRLENTWLMLPTTNGNSTIDDTLSWRVTGSYSNYDPILNVKDPLRQLTPYVSLEHRYINLLLGQSATGAQFTQLYVPKDGRYRIFGYVRVASTASGASNYNGKFRIMLNLKYEAAEGGGFTPVYENLYYSEYPIATNNVFDVVVDLQAGDLISMSNEYGLTNATLSGDIGFDLDQAYTENTDTGYLLDYPIRENLPEIGCIEFITGLFGMMGLVAQSNGTGINVFSINDVINNADSVDIAGYINDREARQLEYSYGLTANNRLTYADDTNGISFAANTYDKAENVVVELPFAAGNDIALYERGENGEFSLKDSEDAKALARSGSRTIKVIDDHASTSAVRDVSVSVFDFVGLDWPTLYATYWGGYKGVFADNQRVVKYKAVIPEAFARALDFSKPVHDGVNRYMLMRVGKYGYTGACELTLAMLDGVEAVTPSGGPVILVDNSIPLMFDTTVVANYAPAGSLLPGKLIRELEETTGPLPAGAMIAVDLGAGEAKKWQPAVYMHSHSNKAFLDLIDQGLSMGSDVKFNSVIAEGAVVAGALNGTLPDDLPVSSPLLYGVSKYDDVTIKINANGQWYVATSGGTVVSFGTEVAGQSIQLIVAAITKTLALAGHTHNYQPVDNDLTAIAALTGTGLLKRTGTDTWTFDTNAYLTAITKAMVEAVLTGDIPTHGHSQYLTAITKAMVEAVLTGDIPTHGHSQYLTAITKGMVEEVLTGIITSHQHNYLPINGGTISRYISIDTPVSAGSSFVMFLRGGTPVGYVGDGASGANTSIDFYNYVSGKALSLGNDGKLRYGAYFVWDQANSNLKTVDWYAKNLYGVNGLFDGAVVAGALNGTLPDDLPVATSLLYGTIKFDPTTLALNGSNQLTVVGGGWSNVAWGTATSQYSPLTINSVTRNLSLDGHTHSYLPLSGGNLNGALTINGSTVWHAGDASIPSNYLRCDSVTANTPTNGNFAIGTDATHNFIQSHAGKPLYLNELGNAVYINNVLAATINSNVASATKLANTKSIWGQPFNGEGNVDGSLSGATTGAFSSTVSATTGIFSNLTANYIPKHTAGGLANSLIYDNGTNVGIGRTDPGYKLDVNGNAHFSSGSKFKNICIEVDANGNTTGRDSEINCYNSSLALQYNTANHLNLCQGGGNVLIGAETDAGYKLDVNGTFRAVGAAYLNSTLDVTSSAAANRFYTGYDSGLANAISCSNWFRSNGATGWLNATYSAGILSDTANIVRTYSTNKFKVYNTAIDSILTLGGVTAANVISIGAVVAGALNGTLPDDLPIATGSLFGVIKTGLSLNNNVGVVNINGRHYTTTSTYTDAACREITAELVLGTGNMTSGTLDQIQLAFAPLTTTRGLTGNIIATATGAGMSLTIGFRKDTGSGRWYLMIYNGTGATVVRDGILISIRGQQTI